MRDLSSWTGLLPPQLTSVMPQAPVTILVCTAIICDIAITRIYIVVLVAHNGFAFDFPILLAEVERRPG